MAGELKKKTLMPYYTAKTASEFFNHDFLAIPSIVTDWLPHEKLRENLQIELHKNLQLMRDDIFAHGFKRLCPVAEACADDYKFQILELSPDIRIMTSIRFKCLDVHQPFVEVLHKNFEIESARQLRAVAAKVFHHYRVFSPKWMRIFDSSGILEKAEDDQTVVCDLKLFAGLIKNLRLRAYPKSYEHVVLEPATDMTIYSRYQDLYGELYKENPALRNMMCKESPHAFQKIRDAGTLFNILIEGKWAGVIGLSKEHEKFLYGYRMVDQIISKSHRGKGFAVAVQRRLIDIVDNKNLEILFGQISPTNISSAKTALRVGRENIGAWYFIKP